MQNTNPLFLPLPIKVSDKISYFYGGKHENCILVYIIVKLFCAKKLKKRFKNFLFERYLQEWYAPIPHPDHPVKRARLFPPRGGGEEHLVPLEVGRHRLEWIWMERKYVNC